MSSLYQDYLVWKPSLTSSFLWDKMPSISQIITITEVPLFHLKVEIVRNTSIWCLRWLSKIALSWTVIFLYTYTYIPFQEGLIPNFRHRILQASISCLEVCSSLWTVKYYRETHTIYTNTYGLAECSRLVFIFFLSFRSFFYFYDKRT